MIEGIRFGYLLHPLPAGRFGFRRWRYELWHGNHMHAALQQLRISLTLHYRNKMALIYSYLFPLIFLLAFYVLYRHERVVLARHMGELLTVSVLGGACFGLPTTMVPIGRSKLRSVEKPGRSCIVGSAVAIDPNNIKRFSATAVLCGKNM